MLAVLCVGGGLSDESSPDGTGAEACVVGVERMNDDYCDCADGSDEPLTSACASVDVAVPLFRCENGGHEPFHLFASRVGDGVCDCCDGADEAPVSYTHLTLPTIYSV